MNAAAAGTRSGPPRLAQLALERELARQAHAFDEAAADGGIAQPSILAPALPPAPAPPSLSGPLVVLAAPPALAAAPDAAQPAQHAASRPARSTGHPAHHAAGGSVSTVSPSAHKPAVVVHVEPNPVQPPGGGDTNPYGDPSAAVEEPSPKQDAVAHRAPTTVRIEPNPVMNPYEQASEPQR